MTFPNLMAASAAPWAVRPDSLPQLQALLATAKQAPAELTAAMGENRPGMGALARGVAVLPVRGFMLNRCNPFEEYFGCCSIERLSASLDMLLQDEAVTAIVLSFDSPGGSVLGIEEFARKILSVRDSKPIVAAIDALAASAAYWIAACCSDVWVTPSGMAGSVGTLMLRYDWSAANAEAGVKVNVISSGTFKAEGIPDTPMSEEEKAAAQAMCDNYYSLFTATVAKGRETTTGAVKAGFGQGRVLTAKDALAEGMVDRIGTMGDVLGKYAGRSKGGVRALSAAPTGLALVAAAHGVAAQTPMDVVAAITGMLTRPRLVAVKADEDPPRDDDETDEEYEARKAKASKKTKAAKTDEEDETDEGASASAATTPPATAPQAKESAMPEPQNGAAPTSGADATQINQRADDIMALAKTHKKDMDWAITQAKSGKTVAAIGLELMAEMRAALDAAPDISARGIQVSGPNESRKPFGSAEYVALAQRVAAGTLKRDDPSYVRAQAGAFGDYLLAVQAAYSPGGTTDPRLFAAATGMNQGVPAEGGFGVLPQFSNLIWDGLETDPNALLSMTDNYTIDGESLTFLANAETSRATGSRAGGVRGYWINEADLATKSKPTFRQLKLEPQEMVVLVYLTDKLIRNNSVGMGQYVNRKAVEEIGFLTGDAIVNGTGSGQPKGILSPGALVTVTKEGSQANTTFNKQNANKMWARLHPRSQATAVWLMNIDVSPQLDEFNTPIKNVAGTENVGGFGSQIYNADRNTLKGRPIIYTEFCGTLGAVGDVILWDPKGYAAGIRGDGVRTDMSIHVRFEYAESAFRFMYEVDGQPWLAAAQTPKNGSATLTTHVVLSAR